MLKSFIEFLLEVLMPSSPVVKKLASMGHAELLEVSRKSSDENDDIISVLSYRDPLAKELIWQIKFKHNKRLAVIAANLLHDSMLAFMLDTGHVSGFERPIVIPVPISKQRRKQRGFNQTDIVVRNIMDLDGGANFDFDESAVTKIKDTPPQTSLKRTEREKNLTNCFAVANPEKIKGKDIFIIDDVYTTGSTITELRRTLILSGAKKVIGFTIAH